MSKFLNFILYVLFNERGDLDLSGVKVELSDLKKDQEKFLKDWNQMKGSIDELHKAQKEGKGSSDTKEKLDRMELSLSKQEDALELMKANMKKMDGFRPTEQVEKEKISVEKKAFDAYLRKGTFGEGLTVEQDGKIITLGRKDFSVGVPAEGGVLVRPEMANEIAVMQQDLNPVREIAHVQTIGSDKYEIIEATGRNAVGWVAENAPRPVTTSMGFAQRIIQVFELYAMPQATQWILDDAFIDLEAWLKEQLAEDFANEEGDKFINGNGTTQPKGFLTYPAGVNRLQIEQIDSGEAATLTDVSVPGLITLQNSLKDAYGKNARWVFNRKTRGMLRQLKIDGKFIFAPGIASVSENTILGDPYTMLAGMPDVAADSLSIAYGDYKKGYQIVDRFGIRMIRDNITVKGKVLFYTTKRVGGDVKDFAALKILKTSV